MVIRCPSSEYTYIYKDKQTKDRQCTKLKSHSTTGLSPRQRNTSRRTVAHTLTVALAVLVTATRLLPLPLYVLAGARAPSVSFRTIAQSQYAQHTLTVSTGNVGGTSP